MAVPYRNRAIIERGSTCEAPTDIEGACNEYPLLGKGLNPVVVRKYSLHLSTIALLEELGNGDPGRGIEALASSHAGRRRYSGD